VLLLTSGNCLFRSPSPRWPTRWPRAPLPPPLLPRFRLCLYDQVFFPKNPICDFHFPICLTRPFFDLHLSLWVLLFVDLFEALSLSLSDFGRPSPWTGPKLTFYSNTPLVSLGLVERLGFTKWVILMRVSQRFSPFGLASSSPVRSSLGVGAPNACFSPFFSSNLPMTGCFGAYHLPVLFCPLSHPYSMKTPTSLPRSPFLFAEK